MFPLAFPLLTLFFPNNGIKHACALFELPIQYGNTLCCCHGVGGTPVRL